LSDVQKAWLSGYLTGINGMSGMSGINGLNGIQQSAAGLGAGVAVLERPAPSLAAPAVSKEITVLFGSQTGNSRGLAKKAAAELEKHGFKTTVAAMNLFKPQKLKKVETLLIIVSTHGEGEPPDNAVSFHEFLHSKRAPKLEHLQFTVLGLGDSSYEFFCQTGKDFDRRLEELGGTRLHPRADCDLDFEGPAAKWLAGVINALKKQELIEAAPAAAALETAPQTTSAYSRSNPFRAEVLENINLNGRGSNKETRHIELSLEGSGLAYQPGDCLGIYPENDPELVERILDELDWNPNESVTINEQGDILSFKEALTTQYEITVLSKPLLEKIAQITGNAALRDLVATEHKLKEYVYGRDLLDLIRDFGPWGETPQEFVSVLRKIPPRLYSISSSFAANPGEVHVTVGVVRYTAYGRQRKGVCSTFCAERLRPGDTVPVFIQENDSFRLPDDPDTPIIMIG
ncbi:MAG: sulfite reductase flavoprotein subunit alpha, partial [Bacillales bacterium]